MNEHNFREHLNSDPNEREKFRNITEYKKTKLNNLTKNDVDKMTLTDISNL